jgi:hypothetical protein
VVTHSFSHGPDQLAHSIACLATPAATYRKPRQSPKPLNLAKWDLGPTPTCSTPNKPPDGVAPKRQTSTMIKISSQHHSGPTTALHRSSTLNCVARSPQNGKHTCSPCLIPVHKYAVCLGSVAHTSTGLHFCYTTMLHASGSPLFGARNSNLCRITPKNRSQCSGQQMLRTRLRLSLCCSSWMVQ